jgi:biopolymer transport protein ExbD
MIRKPTEETIFANINITPLIDILLVLVVMLIISIPIKLNFFNMNFASSGSPAKDEIHQTVHLKIAANGEILWDKTLINNTKELDNNFAKLKQKNNQDDVELTISKNAVYKQFTTVMSSAQRNNITNIHIVND